MKLYLLLLITLSVTISNSVNSFTIIQSRSICFNNKTYKNELNTIHMKSDDIKWSPSTMVKHPDYKSFDVRATFSYIAATVLQWNLIRFVLTNLEQKGFVFLTQVDLTQIYNAWLLNYVPKTVTLPKFDILPNLSDINSIVVIVLMFFLSVRSRIFSPLDNSRPKANGSDPVFRDMKRPSWQPPAIAFPFIWTTISILRTASAYLIYKSTGSIVSSPLLAFFAHLSIGDTWNTINNVEKRLGTAALGVLFVLGSVFFTTYQYYKTYPLAGYILAPSCVWLSVATVLIFTIWRINYDSAGKPSFYPSNEEGPRCKWKIPLFPK